MKKHKERIFFVLFFWLVSVASLLAQNTQFVPNPTSNWQKVDNLLIEADQAFNSPDRISDPGFTAKTKSNLDVVADRLFAAFELEPWRADLLFSAASARVYNKEIEKAVVLYNKILEIAPSDVDAHFYLAAWNHFLGNKKEMQTHSSALSRLDRGKADKLKKMLALIEESRQLILTEHPAWKGTPDTIVTLGYVLNADGSMNSILLKRLEKTLELAQQFPEATLIVTGGVVKMGKTEASLMANWLVDHGIERERIKEDNYATSTVENALNSRYILSEIRAKNVILLSSGSHVRRAYSIFNIALWESGPEKVQFQPAFAVDRSIEDLKNVSRDDLIGIYRDSLSALGLWSFRSSPLLKR